VSSDTAVVDTATSGDANADAVDSSCKPGDIRMEDCNTCSCTSVGTWDCTKKVCPTPCPKDAPKGGGKCVGATHCIYTVPCSFGCDCVDGNWECVDCAPPSP
jgi:hypothetical protein